MDVARYATPYLARRDLALAPSLDFRDWNSPASRPNFSVVSSALMGVDVVSAASLSVLKMRRAEEVRGGRLSGPGWSSPRWRAARLFVEVDGVWKDTAPSRTASTMRDLANESNRDRNMLVVMQRRLMNTIIYAFIAIASAVSNVA